MADIQFNVDAALAKLGELVAKHGPEAVNLAASVVQVNAVGTFVTGGVCLALATGCGLLAHKSLSLYRQESAKDYLKQDDGRIMTGIFGTVIPGVVGTILGIISIVNLADVWSWVGLFNPKLALAHAVLAKFAGI